MTIIEKKKNLISKFENIETWEDKYKLIVQFGKELSPIDEKFRTDKYKIKGCQSQVWLHAEEQDGRINFIGDSDAMIVKGIISLLITIFNNETPDEILKEDLSFLDDIGIRSHLSLNRSNGLFAMIKQIKLYATAFQALKKI